MNHKERVLKALNKEVPDRVPFFYWDTPEFGEKMMSYLGFTNRDQLLEYLDVDFRWVEPDYIGPQLVDQDNKKKKDIWGVGYSRISTGEYEYWQADYFPLEGVTDPAALDDFNWPTNQLFDFTSLEEQLQRYNEYAIMTAPGYSSPGLFRIVQRLIGRETFMDVMMSHPKFFKSVCDKVIEFYSSFVDEFFEVAQKRIDFIRVADDFGSQSGLTIGNDHWDNYIRPSIDAFTRKPKEMGAHFYMHSCGGVRKLLPKFISAGAEVLDPIQTRATGMSPEGLKKDFGQLITFCGAMDEELLLRQGTADQVRQGVKELLDVMGPGGRFILGPSHKIKVETPVENVIAMYETAREWRHSTE
ncbi:uroporphyrinogen decarboxylase family protein [Plebeiibacterium marinum]|uniref:Uroporphyrinogen-III decarboxylase n=1 Tax=Plebeiibacterium marinum TaxID=2992111 RepID=A0AAE3MIH1_9BACT|nr:uroporphyrinogen decarboxylase family protein [Plebeiobacterium marinum]MCW3807692.1 uroporphyrinogen-III decarboxylase [Plebeiobacterium marinum]